MIVLHDLDSFHALLADFNKGSHVRSIAENQADLVKASRLGSSGLARLYKLSGYVLIVF